MNGSGWFLPHRLIKPKTNQPFAGLKPDELVQMDAKIFVTAFVTCC